MTGPPPVTYDATSTMHAQRHADLDVAAALRRRAHPPDPVIHRRLRARAAPVGAGRGAGLPSRHPDLRLRLGPLRRPAAGHRPPLCRLHHGRSSPGDAGHAPRRRSYRPPRRRQRRPCRWGSCTSCCSGRRTRSSPPSCCSSRCSRRASSFSRTCSSERSWPRSPALLTMPRTTAGGPSNGVAAAWLAKPAAGTDNCRESTERGG